MDSVNFDRAAAFYDATRALPDESMARLTDLLAAELAGRQPCLEIGVGSGRFALPLRARGITIVGTDISGAMLRRLAANAGGRSPLPLAQADATAQPLRAQAFGSVLAVHVLHLIPGWRLAVDEAMRVLRPGGALIASFPTDNRPVPSPGADPAPGDGPEAARTAEAAAASGVLSPGDALGMTRDAAAPWAGAIREAARRHGMARVPIGASDPAAVAAYLDGRAVARQLEPVPVRSSTTLGGAIESIDRQLFSWTWPYTAEQAAAVAADVRAWAERQNLPLDTAHATETASRWWSFERPAAVR